MINFKEIKYNFKENTIVAYDENKNLVFELKSDGSMYLKAKF